MGWRQGPEPRSHVPIKLASLRDASSYGPSPSQSVAGLSHPPASSQVVNSAEWLPLNGGSLYGGDQPRSCDGLPFPERKFCGVNLRMKSRPVPFRRGPFACGQPGPENCPRSVASQEGKEEKRPRIFPSAFPITDFFLPPSLSLSFPSPHRDQEFQPRTQHSSQCGGFLP